MASSLSQYSPAIDQADPALLGPGVLGRPDGIDFDAGNVIRPDGHPKITSSPYNQLNPIYGYASDIGADEYWKEFGCEDIASQPEWAGLPGESITYTVNVINVGNPSKLLPQVISHGFTDTISIP